MSAPEIDARLAMLLTRDRGVLSHNEEAAIRELTAENAQLRAQVAALKVALREDVELVAEVCNDYGNDEGPRGIRRLYAQFEARIEAAAR